MQADPTPSCERFVTHTGPVFRVESITMLDASGRRVRRDIVRHPGAVTVVPELADGRLVLIRNHRVAVERRLVEFCAGKLERGEDPAVAAGRELEEECGYRPRSIERIGAFYTSPGFADEWMHVFRASDLEAIPRRLEPGEDIEVFTATPEEVAAMVATGAIVDGKTIAAWALWRARRATGGAP